MVTKDSKKLLQKLNDHLTRALEAAAGFCIARTHYEVTFEHVLLKLLEDGSGDIPRILNHFGVDSAQLWETLLKRLETYRAGNTGRPIFSILLLQLIESAWIAASVHHGASQVRSGHLLEALLEHESLRLNEVVEVLAPVRPDELRERFIDLVVGSSEDRPALRTGGPRSAEAAKRDGETALDLYTLDVTARAREGQIDPVFARDKEIRQIIDILSRRRKNNPILVGEAGVGKTAVVEGLALRIVQDDVPAALAEVEIRTLDLGLLQAGAGVKGEFENRLKSVIQEVREAPKPTILFIDEAHTLIGAGGAAGTSDAANLLKPALARGELRTIAATTWSEYKKYVEKDPALERRFQMVKVEEPSVDDAAVMLRGIKAKYEDHHGVHISNEAAAAAARLSERYLTGRQLPDKAVDLLDTTSARVKMSQSAKPAALDDVERRLLNLSITLSALRRDLETGLYHDDRELGALEAERRQLEAEKQILEERWQREGELVGRIEDLRRDLVKGLTDGDSTTTNGGLASVAWREELDRLVTELAALQAEDDALVYAEVNEDIVAQVISDWTGIPVGNMVKDEAALLLALEEQLQEHIKGQDEAIEEIADSIRAAKAGMGNADAPIAVSLLVGPSGVGKTEAARTLAELLFGGERFLVTINMSEYQEAHTVSQLKGSPPGYVGYGEGGVLTEAVRQRPYSVVLLDEVEKAHLDVMELFYQVFDRGFMRDGEGREINFRNTIILMTSNVGADIFLEVCTEDERPTPDQLRECIHHLLVRQFQAALLARMKIVPFYPLRKEAMKRITHLKLNKIGRRLHDAHGMAFHYDEVVVDRIAERCTQVDSGARNIDFIIERTLLPEASKALLAKMAEEAMPEQLHLGITAEGDFTYAFDGESYESESREVSTSPSQVALEHAAPSPMEADSEAVTATEVAPRVALSSGSEGTEAALSEEERDDLASSGE